MGEDTQRLEHLEKRIEVLENYIRNKDQIEKSKKEYEQAIENARNAMLELLKMGQAAFGDGISTKPLCKRERGG